MSMYRYLWYAGLSKAQLEHNIRRTYTRIFLPLKCCVNFYSCISKSSLPLHANATFYAWQQMAMPIRVDRACVSWKEAWAEMGKSSLPCATLTSPARNARQPAKAIDFVLTTIHGIRRRSLADLIQLFFCYDLIL